LLRCIIKVRHPDSRKSNYRPRTCSGCKGLVAAQGYIRAGAVRPGLVEDPRCDSARAITISSNGQKTWTHTGPARQTGFSVWCVPYSEAQQQRGISSSDRHATRGITVRPDSSLWTATMNVNEVFSRYSKVPVENLGGMKRTSGWDMPPVLLDTSRTWAWPVSALTKESRRDH